MSDELVYSAENIKVLRGYEAIRLRPGMYIGDTGEYGLRAVLMDLVTHEMNRLVRGEGARIGVTLLADGGFSVEDNGPPLPIDGMLEEMASQSLAGRPHGTLQPPVVGGLYGLDLLVSNALSRRFDIEVRRDGGCWRQSFAQGKVISSLERVGDAEGEGNLLSFWPDPEIFSPAISIPRESINNRLRELAALYPGLTLTIRDERDGFAFDHYSPQGLQYLAELRRPQDQGSSPVLSLTYLHGEIQTEEGRGQIVFGWFTNSDHRLVSYANGMFTQGGEHVRSFIRGLSIELGNVPELHALRDESFVSGQAPVPFAEVMRDGLVAVIAVEVPGPQYNAPTKDILSDMGAFRLMHALARQCVQALRRDHPQDLATLVEHLQRAAEAAAIAKQARAARRDRKTGEP